MGRPAAETSPETLPATTGPLSDEERAALADQFRLELEQEHQSRLERLQKRQEDARTYRDQRLARLREVEAARIKDEVRAQFFREHGYQRVEENGRERWIPAEEYAYKRRARGGKPRHSRAVGAMMQPKWKMVPLYVLMVLVAIVIGLLVVR